MRRQYNNSHSSLQNSKRIAVALCAAIAMVLGAMSVGARYGITQSDQPAAPADTSAIIANLEAATNGSDNEEATQDKPLSSNHRRQQALVPSEAPKSTPGILVNPKNPKVDVSLGPIKTLITEEKIKVDVNTPPLSPLVSPLPVDTSATVEVPSVTDTMDDIGSTVAPTTQLNPQQQDNKSPSVTDKLLP